MSVRDTQDVLKCLKPFPKDVRERALWLRKFVWDLYPKANELIYDNYNAVAIGWSPTDRVGDTFCTIAVGRSSHNVHFGFYWGSKIADPKGLLIGEGKQYRYILVTDIVKFPKAYMKSLMREAHTYSVSNMKLHNETHNSETILKSVSPLKRKPGKGK